MSTRVMHDEERANRRRRTWHDVLSARINLASSTGNDQVAAHLPEKMRIENKKKRNDDDDDDFNSDQSITRLLLDDALLDVNIGILDAVGVHHLAILDNQSVLGAL